MSHLKHPLERHLQPDVFAPGAMLPPDRSREPIFGPGLPWFIGLAVGVLLAAYFWEGSIAMQIIGPAIGVALSAVLVEIYR